METLFLGTPLSKGIPGNALQHRPLFHKSFSKDCDHCFQAPDFSDRNRVKTAIAFDENADRFQMKSVIAFA
jgi:hypothetical protein